LCHIQAHGQIIGNAVEQYYLQNSIKCLGFYASCSNDGHFWVFTLCILICSNMPGERVTFIFRVAELVRPDPPEPSMNFIIDKQMHFGFMM
jgi:hypothetical protein